MKRYNCLDGEMDGLIEFDAQLAISPVKDNPIDRDNFYPADGEEITFSNARGKRKKEKIGEKILSYTPLGWIKKGVDSVTSPEAKKARQERKKMRAEAKLESAKGQKAIAESLGKESKADIEMAKALQTPVETKKGLSMTAKVGIGLGVVAVLGIGAYFLLKKKK